ncbi:hypothetical protein HK098_004708 [Nowakowskiella sp. JEL0407]|nr:hypothetical protein HK098_004708 [Nowakowskiella sp. JEL0407]
MIFKQSLCAIFALLFCDLILAGLVTKPSCGTTQAYLAKHPKAKHNKHPKLTRRDFEGEIEATIVPVYFHVIHNGKTGNVTDTILGKSLDLLNEGFNNTKFRFTLGSTKRYNQKSWFKCGNDTKFGPINLQNKVPGVSSLNIYTCDIETVVDGSEIIGLGWLADLAESAPELDAVRIDYQYLPDGPHSNYIGKTIIHEVGHFMGLYHTWGDDTSTSCSKTDDVADTPNVSISPSSCKGDVDSCPKNRGFDEVENYMLDIDESCRYHFTPGQIRLMHWSWDVYRDNATIVKQSSNSNGWDYFNDFSFVDSKISATPSVSSESNCRDTCFNDPTCKGYTWDSNSCYLIKRLNVGKQKSGASSALRTGDRSPKMTSQSDSGIWEYFDGYEIADDNRSTILDYYFTSNRTECAPKCEANPNCIAYTWSGYSNVCYLQKKIPYLRACVDCYSASMFL